MSTARLNHWFLRDTVAAQRRVGTLRNPNLLQRRRPIHVVRYLAVATIVVMWMAALVTIKDGSFAPPWQPGGAQPMSLGSPTNGSLIFAATPAPVECTVEPRTIEEVILLVGIADPSDWDEPYGQSLPPDREEPRPTGEPASAETVAAIKATMDQFALCSQTGTLLLQMAFWSDDLIKRVYTEPLTSDVIPALQDGPDASPNEPISMDLAVERAELLEDGRVIADVQATVPSDAGADLEFVSIVFVQQGHRWLMDEVLGTAASGPSDPSAADASVDQAALQGTTFVINPAAARCDVTPRTAEELAALTSSSGSPIAGGNPPGEISRSPSLPSEPSSSPSPALQGTPAMSETTAEIEKTVLRIIECRLRGSTLQRLATLSADNIRLNGVLMPRDIVNLAATPPASRFTFAPRIMIQVESVQRLSDGRVAATVSQYYIEGETPSRFQLIVVREEDRWLLDETIGIEPFFPTHRVVSGPIDVYDRPGADGTILAVTQPREELDYRGGLMVIHGDVWIYARAESGIAG